MKILTLLAIPIVFIVNAFAQETQQPAKPQQSEALQKSIAQFRNLPAKKRQEYAKQFREAQILFNNKRVFESLEIIDNLKNLTPNNPDLINIEAACLVALRNFDAAEELYLQSQVLLGENMSILFNLGEIAFVSQQWEKALQILTKTLKATPETNMSMYRLIEFKILLCHIALSEDPTLTPEERKKHAALAKKMAHKYEYRDNSPYYYYAHFAYLYSQDDKPKAFEFLNAGRRIYSGALSPLITAWEDSITEFGYLNNYYGGKVDNAYEASKK